MRKEEAGILRDLESGRKRCIWKRKKVIGHFFSSNVLGGRVNPSSG